MLVPATVTVVCTAKYINITRHSIAFQFFGGEGQGFNPSPNFLNYQATTASLYRYWLISKS